MPTNQNPRDFVAYTVDLMQCIGPVYSKRMFGGFGIFLDGLMFGLIADNVLYLKTDASNRADFEDLGLEAFSYQKKDKLAQLNYFQAPEEALENLDIMQAWGNRAYAVALNAAASKRRRGKK